LSSQHGGGGGAVVVVVQCVFVATKSRATKQRETARRRSGGRLCGVAFSRSCTRKDTLFRDWVEVWILKRSCDVITSDLDVS
jgi:hypothetical protein